MNKKTMKKNSMTPINVGAPVLIPYADTQDTPGSFGWLRKQYEKAHTNKHRFNASISSMPSFVPGYTFKGLEGNWQSYDNCTLSESDIQLVEELVKKYGKDALLTESSIGRKLGTAALAGALLFGDGACTRNYIPSNKIEQQEKYTFNKKVNAVAEIMKNNVMLNGGSVSDIQLSPEWIVLCAESEDFDIPFMLAVLQIESHFGITPRALKTNSPFSQGCYDNGRNRTYFNNQNDSVIPFINLIKGKYLLDGKYEIDDILKPNMFVNGVGNRYSSNPRYESLIKRTRDSLIQKYPILAKK